MQTCPLCEDSQIHFHFEDKLRAYFKCNSCFLIFVEQENLLELSDEKKIYDLHENDPSDVHYQNFMNRILLPFSKYIKGEGLDFGCGPGPIISTMINSNEATIYEYDPIFKNHLELLERRYDFLISTEVIEHIYNSKKDFELMLSLLKPLGALGIMTSFYPDDMKLFKSWGYKNDPTHVRFFNERTFEWIAKKYDLDLEVPRKNVAFLKRK